jgi:hypothetical protein
MDMEQTKIIRSNIEEKQRDYLLMFKRLEITMDILR